MTRKKVKLVWIVNDAARKASLKKRRIGLLKKVSELTTLCGVNAFAIIYSPDENDPMVWPSRPVVEDMLTKFHNIPEIERSKKMMNQESYLKERMAKLQEQSRKNTKKNQEIEMSYLMDKLHRHGNGINALDCPEIQSLVWLLEERMKDLRKRVDYFQQAPPLTPPGSFLEPAPPAQPFPPLPPAAPMGQEGGGNLNEGVAWDQWFIDMMNNSENVAGGSGGARNDHIMMAAPPPPPPPPPHGYNTFHSAGVDMRVIGLGPPSAGVNPFDFGLMHHHANPNPNFGLGFPTHGDFVASSGGNPMGFGSLPPPTTAPGGGSVGGDEGLQGFLGGGSEMGGLPWPSNFSP